MLHPLPEQFVADIYLARKQFVEEVASGKFNPMRLIELSSRLSAMVATSGPAGINVSPFMVAFVPKAEFLRETIEKIKAFVNSDEPANIQKGTKFVLENLYRDEILEPTKLITHLMNKGHTFENISANGRASLGFLIPPDKGAYEVRVKGTIYETGEFYEFANLSHDIIHVKAHGEREHPWFPALVMEIEEIYDNSYHKLGTKIYPRNA